MSTKLRVVLADDSAVVRRLLTEVLNADPSIEVIGSAKHGQEAVTMVQSNSADLVLLDVEMPLMDGIEAVHEIRRFNRRIPIVMFSSLTVKGGAATLDALAAGANDFVPKPNNVGHMQQALDYLRQELVPKIKQFGKPELSQVIPFRPAGIEKVSEGVMLAKGLRTKSPVQEASNPPLSKPTSTAQSAAATKIKSSGSKSFDVVAIGSSTGGPTALEEVLCELPEDFSAAILVVQHMPPIFTQLLAERLDKRCHLQVREGADGVVISPGQVWIAPGDFHLRVERDGVRNILRTDKSPHENSCRPAADVLFRSVAQLYGSRSLAVVLTGMGRDGLAGCREIRSRGGRVIVQDEATSVVWGMPRAITEAGLADRSLPICEIGQELQVSITAGRRSLAHA